MALTPKEWLRRERIVGALRAMRCGLLVKQAAAECGFRFPGDFAREFRIWTGMCPNEFVHRLQAQSARNLIGGCRRDSR